MPNDVSPAEIRRKIKEKQQHSADTNLPQNKQLVKSDRKFVLVTDNGDGLGFADQEIRENGSTVIMAIKPKPDLSDDKLEALLIQGRGIVPTFALDGVFKDRADYKDYFWVFDGNHNTDIGEKLRSEGFKVWNGSEFQYTLENDREEGLEFAESVGLKSPPFHEFKSGAEGITFLEQNPMVAFVVKPNGAEESHLTQTFREETEDFEANIACRKYIKAMGLNDFILQERKKGIEVNTEIFFSHGKPVLAQANLEDKRRHNDDLGYACGCAFDVCWEIALDSPLVQKTVAKFIPKLAEIDYTGFADTNVIISDENEIWFLEFCFRTGYNAHPNFFNTLSKKTYLQTVADLIDGVPVAAKKGFGASYTLFCDKFKEGLPIHVAKQVIPFFHLIDGYRDEDSEHPGDYLMGGYGPDIGIVTAFNYTIETAFQDALNNANQIKFVNKDHRTDAAGTGYPLSPVRRYEALRAMGII